MKLKVIVFRGGLSCHTSPPPRMCMHVYATFEIPSIWCWVIRILWRIIILSWHLFSLEPGVSKLEELFAPIYFHHLKSYEQLWVASHLISLRMCKYLLSEFFKDMWSFAAELRTFFLLQRQPASFNWTNWQGHAHNHRAGPAQMESIELSIWAVLLVEQSRQQLLNKSEQDGKYPHADPSQQIAKMPSPSYLCLVRAVFSPSAVEIPAVTG